MVVDWKRWKLNGNDQEIKRCHVSTFHVTDIEQRGAA